MKLSALTPDTRNANRGTDRGRKLVRESLKRYGAGRSILIDKSGNVIAGNKTLEGAQAIGLEDCQIVKSDGTRLVAVQRTDLDINDKAARELAIADNRASELGLEWDPDVLKALETEVDVDLSPFWDERELVQFWADGKDEPQPRLDQANALQKAWETRPGQIWAIPSASVKGNHRLMCGSSTERADVEKLLAGVTPTLIATDPPYGIELDAEWRDRAGINGAAACPSYMRSDHYENKDMSGDTKADWSDAFELVPSALAIYVWHASKFTREVLTGLERIGFEHFQQIIWRKPMATRTRTHYWYQHEPCWYGRKKNAPWFGAGGTETATIWEATPSKFIFGGRDEAKIDHPTQKPIELFKIPLRNHLEDGEIVYEPFSGSGTCLAAAEATKRICCAMEIEPRYVAVNLQRLSDMGLKPELTHA